MMNLTLENLLLKSALLLGCVCVAASLVAGPIFRVPRRGPAKSIETVEAGPWRRLGRDPRPSGGRLRNRTGRHP